MSSAATQDEQRGLDLHAAVAAARAAARACRAVQAELEPVEALEKRDRSPVTVADFASQALVCAHLERACPGDAVVGEESAAALRKLENAAVLEAVLARVGDELGGADRDQVLHWIDLGGADARGERYWTLDPIDGTKGFLRGEQYAVALALIEGGQVQLGVLACPNLAGPDGAPPGVLFSAVRGGRTRSQPLWQSAVEALPVAVTAVRTPADARFCESVESEHSDQDQSAEIARLLGITREPYRIDSQCKYAAVARGDASIYLRLPTRSDYRECIWDHAAGSVIVEAAGGRVTDATGAPLDFTTGRKLEHNRGIVATAGPIHDEVIRAVARVADLG